MSSTPEFEVPREERLDSNLPDHHPVASEAGPGLLPRIEYNGIQYPYTINVSPTLAEDARALLDGDADYLLGNTGLVIDVDGFHGVGQDIVDAVAPYAVDLSVAPQTDSRNTIPYVSLPQLRTQVLVAPVIPPIIPPVNNQVQHANATASRQCPHGCPSTFGRPGEYRRHMKKHNGPFFPCTRPHCGRMFYRQDKLNDHLNKGH